MKTASFAALFKGGLDGNLGMFLFAFFLLLIPNLCFLYKAIRLRFYFLKFIQYPGLLIFAFYLFVYFIRQDRWLSAEWKANFTQFVLVSSLATNSMSLFSLRYQLGRLKLIIPFCLAPGFLLYFLM